MTAFYRYSTLRTDNTDQARAHNDEWLGAQTLGIEVTIGALARQCELGHIDPQHRMGGKSSAIEESLGWPLPPDGARLVTIRHDRDSIGAMAVLRLRSQRMEDRIDKLLVSMIGVLDRKSIDQARVEDAALLSMSDQTACDILNYIVKLDPEDMSLPWKVTLVADILSRQMSQEDISEYALKASGKKQARRASGGFVAEWYGNVGYVYALREYDRARSWANTHFPIAVIHDPERITGSGGKQDRWCVVRQVGVFDRNSFVMAVNLAEAEARGLSILDLTEKGLTWGGPQNLVTSPQGEGNDTRLSKEQILELVCQHFESGAVS